MESIGLLFGDMFKGGRGARQLHIGESVRRGVHTLMPNFDAASGTAVGLLVAGVIGLGVTGSLLAKRESLPPADHTAMWAGVRTMRGLHPAPARRIIDVALMPALRKLLHLSGRAEDILAGRSAQSLPESARVKSSTWFLHVQNALERACLAGGTPTQTSAVDDLIPAAILPVQETLRDMHVQVLQYASTAARNIQEALRAQARHFSDTVDLHSAITRLQAQEDARAHDGVPRPVAPTDTDIAVLASSVIHTRNKRAAAARRAMGM
jgi:hypothetical protein